MSGPTGGGDLLADIHRSLAAFAATYVELPLYRRICEAAATDDDVARLLTVAAAGQARAVLLLAALHDLVLRRPDLPAARWYPSVTGGPVPPGDPWPDVRDAALGHATELRRVIAARSTQTNEVNRAVYLAPLLARAAADVPGAPVALVELGSSAGLLLGLDRYRVELRGGAVRSDAPCEVVQSSALGDGRRSGLPGPSAPVRAVPGTGEGRSSGDWAAPGGPVLDDGVAGRVPEGAGGGMSVSDEGTVVLGDPASPVICAGEVRSGFAAVRSLALPRVSARVGLDRSPVDLVDDDAVRWLEACLWPDVPGRLERFRAAVALARRGFPVVGTGVPEVVPAGEDGRGAASAGPGPDAGAGPGDRSDRFGPPDSDPDGGGAVTPGSEGTRSRRRRPVGPAVGTGGRGGDRAWAQGGPPWISVAADMAVPARELSTSCGPPWTSVAGDMVDDLVAVGNRARAAARADLGNPGPEVHLVVMCSWALTYVARDRRPRVAEALAELAADGSPVSWITAEPPGCVPALPPVDDDGPPGGVTVLGSRRWRSRAEVPPAVWGTAHPHGEWLVWGPRA